MVDPLITNTLGKNQIFQCLFDSNRRYKLQNYVKNDTDDVINNLQMCEMLQNIVKTLKCLDECPYKVSSQNKMFSLIAVAIMSEEIPSYLWWLPAFLCIVFTTS